MLDSNDLETLPARVANFRSLIVTAVRFACWKHKYKATPEEIEDFTEDIIKLLLEDDCRRFRTYSGFRANE